MPMRDGSGPRGMGPTGRGMGPCGQGQMNRGNFPNRRGAGRSGRGRCFYGAGVYEYPVENDDLLEREKSFLESRLNEIKSLLGNSKE